MNKPDKPYKRIEISSGVVLVDEEDYAFLAQFKWFPQWGRNTIYARRNGNPSLMHRLIMKAEKGQVIDHIDGNGCNNRRDNLRFSTHSDNIRRQKVQERNSLGAKGVLYLAHLNRKPFRAEVVLHQQTYHVGYFATLEEAVAAREAFLAGANKP